MRVEDSGFVNSNQPIIEMEKQASGIDAKKKDALMLAVLLGSKLYGESLADVLGHKYNNMKTFRFESGKHFAAYLQNSLPNILLVDSVFANSGWMHIPPKDKKIRPRQILLVTDDFSLIKLHTIRQYEGIISGRSSILDLQQCIDQVLVGKRFIAQDIQELIIQNELEETTTAPSLTTRQREILQQLCLGYTNEKIAVELHLSVHTVHSYIKQLCEKLGLRRKVELVRYAVENGLFQRTAPK